MKAVDWRHTLQLLNGVTHLPSQRATTLSAYSNQISVRTLLTPAYLVLPYHAYVFLSLHSTVVAACPDLGILGFSRPQQRPSNQLCQGGDTSNLQATQNRNHFVRRSKQRVGPAGLLENLPPTAPLSLSSVLFPFQQAPDTRCPAAVTDLLPDVSRCCSSWVASPECGA